MTEKQNGQKGLSTFFEGPLKFLLPTISIFEYLLLLKRLYSFSPLVIMHFSRWLLALALPAHGVLAQTSAETTPSPVTPASSSSSSSNSADRTITSSISPTFHFNYTVPLSTGLPSNNVVSGSYDDQLDAKLNSKDGDRDMNLGHSDFVGGDPPDVLLRIPQLSVGKIELDVDNLEAHLNLDAEIANLVTINAGVAIGIKKVNITISDVMAKVELEVRLGHLVDIVNRVFQSLDLNPLLLGAIDAVTDVVDTTVTGVAGVVGGLLGTVTQGNKQLSFMIDNLGNIVHNAPGPDGQEVSTIVGDFRRNMTFTGQQKKLKNGQTEKTYSFPPLNALVDIVFNTDGQVVQATVEGKGGNGGQAAGGGEAAPAGAATGASPAANAQVNGGAGAGAGPAGQRKFALAELQNKLLQPGS
jgi:hypothetical protein